MARNRCNMPWKLAQCPVKTPLLILVTLGVVTHPVTQPEFFLTPCQPNFSWNCHRMKLGSGECCIGIILQTVLHNRFIIVIQGLQYLIADITIWFQSKKNKQSTICSPDIFSCPWHAPEKLNNPSKIDSSLHHLQFPWNRIVLTLS